MKANVLAQIADAEELNLEAVEAFVTAQETVFGSAPGIQFSLDTITGEWMIASDPTDDAEGLAVVKFWQRMPIRLTQIYELPEKQPFWPPFEADVMDEGILKVWASIAVGFQGSPMALFSTYFEYTPNETVTYGALENAEADWVDNQPQLRITDGLIINPHAQGEERSHMLMAAAGVLNDRFSLGS